jgi:3-hydroxyacyl-[acyl-carrier-protein] dehydratase
MDKEDIKKIIPHREPMLLVSEVTAMDDDKILGAFEVDKDWDIFAGHFPGAPVLPGIFQVECMAQISDILIMSATRYKGLIPYFIGINNVRFREKVHPGAKLILSSSILNENREKAIITCAAAITVEGKEVATGEVTLAMRP